MLGYRTILSSLALALAVGAGACAADDVGGQVSDATDIGVQWDDPSVGPSGRWPGQTEFESAAPWSHMWRPWLRSLANNESATQRVVEESDIVKVDGNRLFVLNPYRGLFSIDITNPDQPAVRGRLRIMGSPQEMYVKGNTAFVLMNGLYSWSADQDYRSALLVVDVSSPQSPTLVSEHRIDGNIVDSRIVGNALYVVSDAWDPQANDSTTHVVSLSIAQPANVTEVERVSFPGTGHVIHVTSEYMFVAKYNYPNAAIQLLDIRDPAGDLKPGNEVAIEGWVQDRFMLDYEGGFLRVVSHRWDDGGHIAVGTYAVNAATTSMAKVGGLDLGNIGQLTAARFDGGRVYLVHQIQVDPLDVVDVSNPSAPALLDRIEIPGWLEHLEVRSGRIAGIGFDVAGTPAPAKLCPGYTYQPLAQGRRLAVALYDVSNTGAVCEAARARFGGDEWTWSNGFYDPKALKLLDAQKLLLVPFSSWSSTGGYENGVQLVDVDMPALDLAARGVVASASQADRSFVSKGRLMVLGDRELSVADIADRDNPIVTARLELARNIVAFEPIPNKDFAVQLVGDYDAAAELRVVDEDHPDAERTAALGIVSLGAPAGEMFVNGSTVTVWSRSYTDEGAKARLVNVDVSKPSQPKLLGTLELPVGYGNDIRPLALRRYVPSTDIVRVRPDLFVVSAPGEEGMRYSVISNKNPGQPVVSYEHVKPNDKTVVLDLKAWWDNLYVVSYTPVENVGDELGGGEHGVVPERGQAPGVAQVAIMPPLELRRGRVKYHVTPVSFSVNGTPKIGPSINVPGRLVDVAQDGKIWTLLDARWRKDDASQSEQKKELFTVKANFSKGKAPLLDGVNLSEGVEDVKVRGNTAYYSEMWSDWRGPIVPLSEAVEAGDEVIAPEPPQSALKLVILNYANPAQIRLASVTTVADDGSYGNLLEVRKVGGKRYGFISMGWGGLSVWDVTNSKAPSLYEFVRSNAWYTGLTVSPENAAAYMAGGYYGVESIALVK